MRDFLKIAFVLLLATTFAGCGAKPAMEGGSSDNSTEYGSVNESSNADGSGGGDSTSFTDEQVEKVDEYVIRRGDNLWNIAAKASVYRSGWLYPLILKANRGKITDPRNLSVGLMLKIPRGRSKAEHDVAREEAMAGTYESELGPLLEMKTDLPSVAPQALASSSARGIATKQSGWIWIFWVLLTAGVTGGAWWYIRKRQLASE